MRILDVKQVGACAAEVLNQTQGEGCLFKVIRRAETQAPSHPPGKPGQEFFGASATALPARDQVLGRALRRSAALTQGTVLTVDGQRAEHVSLPGFDAAGDQTHAALRIPY